MKIVNIHPTVLLSILDHCKRTRSTQRVVGVLLGSFVCETATVVNSFAVPFEEDDKEIWFLDHNYLENMFALFKKVNSKEKIIGWYHTGNSLTNADLSINELFKRYCDKPVLVILDQNLKSSAFYASEQMDEKKTVLKFSHIKVNVESEEAEEIGVEHLLRDVKDISVNSMTQQINEKFSALQELEAKIGQICEYLRTAKTFNHQILFNIQKIHFLLENIFTSEINDSLKLMNNDLTMMNYISSCIRNVISIHHLIDNRMELNSNKV